MKGSAFIASRLVGLVLVWGRLVGAGFPPDTGVDGTAAAVTSILVEPEARGRICRSVSPFGPMIDLSERGRPPGTVTMQYQCRPRRAALIIGPKGGIGWGSINTRSVPSGGEWGVPVGVRGRMLFCWFCPISPSLARWWGGGPGGVGLGAVVRGGGAGLPQGSPPNDVQPRVSFP